MPTFSIFTVLFITLMSGVHNAHATVFDCYTAEVTVGCYFPEHSKYALCKESNLACLPGQCLVGKQKIDEYCEALFEQRGCRYAVYYSLSLSLSPPILPSSLVP